MAIQERLTLRNMYLYLVCLITLVISIFGAVNLVRNAVELLYPDPGYHGHPEPFREEKLNKEELARLEQQAQDSQRRQAVLGLVSSGTTLLIAGPVYLYHWRRVQAELPVQPPDESGAGPTST